MENQVRKEVSSMSQRVNNEDAAKEIGCCKSYMFEKMRDGIWDLGTYEKPKGRKKATVFVFRDKLNKFLGKMSEQEEQVCEQQETS